MTVSTDSSDGDGLRSFLRESVVTGTAVTLPLLVTVLVLDFLINFVSQLLDPAVQLVIATTSTGGVSDTVLKLITLVMILGAILVVGVVSELDAFDVGGGAAFEALVARIPGVGSLYQGIDEMSRILLDNDTDSFQEVKLVEFPTDESFAIAFLTAETPDVITDPLEHEEMVTVYLPLAPNPVMGGYALHVSTDRVYDVDMTVEEGIQSIVTSGVATGHHDDEALPADVLDRIERRFNSMDIVPGFESFEEYTQVPFGKLDSNPETGQQSRDETTEFDSGER